MEKYKLLHRQYDQGVGIKTDPESRRYRTLYIVKFSNGYTVGVTEGDGGYNLAEGLPIREDAIDVMMDDLLVNGGAGFIGFVIEGEGMLMTEKTPFTGIPADLPAINELACRDQWVVWKYEKSSSGNQTKIPVNARSGRNANSSDPETWSSFSEAVQFALSRKLAGVGYVLTDDDEYTGIDLDKCIDDDGNIEPWAQEILDLCETYAEYSPSGNGIRMFAKGKIDRSIGSNNSRVEMYRTTRYLTVTGSHVYGSPKEIKEAPETVKRLLARVNEFRANTARPFSQPALPSYSQSSTSIDEIRDMLFSIHPDCPYDDWLKAMMAVHDMTNGSAEGFSLVDNWSSGGSKYPGTTEVELKWRSFRGTGVGSGTLATIAQSYGADLSEIAKRHTIYPEPTEEQKKEWKQIADNLLEGILKLQREKEGTRQVVEQEDGTITDADTGEIIETVFPDMEPKETHISYPPGLVGDIARWMVATAIKPQPALAIGAALTIVGAAAGRQFTTPVRKGGTVLYVLGLAPTAQGKEAQLDHIRRIFKAAGLGHHLGPDEFMSQSALIKKLVKMPLCLTPMDEFGDFMRRIYSKNGNAHSRAILKILRTVWGKNFGNCSSAEWADMEGVDLTAPHLSIFTASTHEQFYSALEGGAVTDGTLNRFLVIEGVKRPKIQENAMDPFDVPADIIDRIRKIYFYSGDLPASWRNEATRDIIKEGHYVEMNWCPDGAKELFSKFRNEIEDRMFEKPDEADLLGRTPEMALRIATIVSIGRLEDKQVRLSDLEFGIDLASQSADMLIHGADSYMAENETEANWKKVYRLIQENKGRIVYRRIQKAMKRMNARQLKDLLQSMCDAGVISRQEVVGQSGGHPVVWYAIARDH